MNLANSHFMLNEMIKESDPIYKRPLPSQKVFHLPYKRESKWPSFKDKINEKYTPARKKDRKFNVWDVNKMDMLECMRSNRKFLNSSTELMESIENVRKTTGLQRKFPQYAKYHSLGGKFVSNDAHNKITGPGFSRNCYGKPYFS